MKALGNRFYFPPAGNRPIRGIHIDLLSLALLVALAANFGFIVFPVLVPEMPTLSYWWMSAGTVTAFVLSLLLRFAVVHLIVGSRNRQSGGLAGFLFGPVVVLPSQEGLPKRLSIAAVADLVALALLAALFFRIFAGAFGDRPPLLAIGPAFALAVGHAALLLFQLLPASPLAGGRLLRAFLARGGRRAPDKTVCITDSIGRGVAALLVLGGLTLAVTGALIPAFWLVAAAVLLWRGQCWNGQRE